ncbi:aldehyde dehydrogenase family protein [Pseudohalocynthiibacter aestuariivivens]|nr:aldehyde dehydrogenase family protein [Pseudohalocynthiibacter aestuariivivens]QIE45207.1 aldehyde dehydrogenase family protein [Pseudohalocynthiibacter aestuariivivens]
MNIHTSIKDLLSDDARAFLAKPKQMLIGDQWLDAQDGNTFETRDPATGELICEVAHASAADVDRAASAAKTALEGDWARFTPAERETAIRRFADLIEANTDLIGQIESLDSGKPVEHIKFVDVGLAVGALRYNAGFPTKIQGDTLPVTAPEMHVYTRREPIGVVGAIVPWNFPICQACFKLAPALAAGCTIILKPAEQTPLSALVLGQLALEAGIPAGVINVLPGHGGTTGQAIVDHPDIHKIAFTGSEAVGKMIASRGSAHLKHVSLELGGKNPNIIFADADLEAAAATAAMAIFFYSGQVCSAGSRLLVEEKAYDRVAEIVLAEAEKIQVGHGLRTDTTMGPLISAQQLNRVEGYVEAARTEGVQISYGGERPGGELSGGHFLKPTVLTHVPDNSRVAREEIFGPVLAMQSFKDMDELVSRANATTFGLAAGVWTHDVRRAHKVSAALQAGTVWVNTYNQFDAAAPWGGYKQSGYGRDNGMAGIEKYLQTKAVWVNYG